MVAYHGQGFHGFASQPGVRTVAGTLSVALARVTRASEPPLLACAGRTDAGVHAWGQVVHADLPDPLPGVRRGAAQRSMTGDDLARAVNSQLAPEVVVRAAHPAPPGWDARRSALARCYRYLVWSAPTPHPLLAAFSWQVPEPLDLRAMASAADAVVGEHDFRAFCKRPPGTLPSAPLVRRVRRAEWSGALAAGCRLPGPSEAAGVEGGRGRLLRFEIEADSFCHQMVRSLVALLVEVGRRRETLAGVVERLRSGERGGSPRPAPAGGLCLVAVRYAPGGPTR